MLEEFKATMKTEFEMSDVGLIKYFLRNEVESFWHSIFVSQQKYVTNILKIFRMNKCNPTENV